MEPNADTVAIISITEGAARKARELAGREGLAGAALRITVTAGGCSGFSYRLAFDDTALPDDHVVEGPEGFRVLIDPRSAPIVQGSTLEFDTALMGGGLKIRNPQVTHECACGESFSV